MLFGELAKRLGTAAMEAFEEPDKLRRLARKLIKGSMNVDKAAFGFLKRKRGNVFFLTSLCLFGGFALVFGAPLLGALALFAGWRIARSLKNEHLIAKGENPQYDKVSKLTNFLKKRFLPKKAQTNFPKVKILPPPTKEEIEQAKLDQRLAPEYNDHARRNFAREHAVAPPTPPLSFGPRP